MLALRPNCECCDRDLPPDLLAAYPVSTERERKPKAARLHRPP